jgi:ankyrin repeat protein
MAEKGGCAPHACLLSSGASARLPVIGALLEGGADVNAKDTSRMTALDYALATEDETLIAFLRERGALPGREVSTRGRRS